MDSTESNTPPLMPITSCHNAELCQLHILYIHLHCTCTHCHFLTVLDLQLTNRFRGAEGCRREEQHTPCCCLQTRISKTLTQHSSHCWRNMQGNRHAQMGGGPPEGNTMGVLLMITKTRCISHQHCMLHLYLIADATYRATDRLRGVEGCQRGDWQCSCNKQQPAGRHRVCSSCRCACEQQPTRQTLWRCSQSIRPECTSRSCSQGQPHLQTSVSLATATRHVEPLQSCCNNRTMTVHFLRG